VTLQTENWHTGYFSPGEHLHQFWFFTFFELKHELNKKTYSAVYVL